MTMKHFAAISLFLLVLFLGTQTALYAVEVTSGTQSAAYTGTMDLVKSTDGEFILNQANRFTGTTTINGGTLKITAGTLISSGGIIVNSGTLSLSSSANNLLGGQGEVPNITLNAGGTLTTTNSQYGNIRHLTLSGGTLASSGSANDLGTYLIGGKVTVTADSAITASKFMIRSVYGTADSAGLWTVNDDATLSVSSEIRMTDSDLEHSKGTLEKLGGGTLTLTKTDTQQFRDGGTLKITAGTVKANPVALSTNSIGANNIKFQFNGGTLQLADGGTLSNEVAVLANSKLVASNANHFYFTNAWTGSKNVTYQSDVRAVGWLRGDMTAYTGTLTLAATGNSEFFMTLDGTAQNSSTYAIHFADGYGRLALNSDTTSDTDFRVGMISGNGIVRHYGNGQASSIKLQVGNDTAYANHEFKGNIFNNSATQIISVEKVGSNTWTLSSKNDYTGGMTLTAGTLEVKHGNALGTGTLTLNGGKLSLCGGDKMTVANAVSILKPTTIFVNEQHAILSGAVTGSADITKTGGKILHFGGSLANYTGTMSSTAAAGSTENGWFIFRDKATDGTRVCVTGNNVAFITTDATPFQFEMFAVGGEVRPSGDSTAGKLITLKVGGNTEYENHTSTAFFNNGNFTMALEKVGSNTWTLTNSANSFNGGTTISGGVLEITSSALSNGFIKLNGGTLRAAQTLTLTNQVTAAADSKVDVAAGKTLTLNQNVTGGKTVEVTGGILSLPNANNTSSWKLGGGTLQLRGGGTNEGGINVAADSTMDVTAGGDYTIHGSLIGSADMTFRSSNNSRGVLRLNGDCSSFTGTIIMAPITGSQNSFFTLESAAKNFSGAAIDLQSKTRFFYKNAAGDVFQVGMLTGASDTLTQAHFEAPAGTTLMKVGNDTNYENHTYSGILQNRDGGDVKILAIEKVGSNTWTLAGSNTYSGETTVSGGTLEITGSLTNSVLTVKQDGTLSLSGNIGKTVTVEDGGTIISTDTATIAGGLTLQGGATLAGDYLGKIRLEKNSQIIMDLSKGSPDLQFNDESVIEDDIALTIDAAGVPLDSTFNLLQTADTDILDKIILDLKNASPNTSWLLSFSPAAITGELGILQLTATINTDMVPEPSAALLLLLGACGLLYFKRR